MGLGYEEWQQVLFDLLVATGEPGRPLYLFVDRDDLAEAGGFTDGEQALDDFCAAYTRHVARTEPFRYEYLRSQGFAPSSRDVPPYLLGLLMSVLAVTEEPIGAAHGVYRRQNALLGREPLPQPPSKYAQHVPAMWQAWNRWLADGGVRYGTPTARSHPHWTHQGWARSQGIFRHQDRLLVQDFFEDRGIEPGDHLDAARLLRELESWLRFHQRDGGRLLQLLGKDEAVRDVLADLLVSELAGWTGQVARSLGERRPRGLLVYDEWSGSFALALTVTSDLEGSRIDVGGVTVPLDAASGLVTVPSQVGPATLLEEGETLRLSDSLALRGGGDSAYVFDESIEAQGLLQERRPLLGRTYTLLVHADALPRVRLALSAAGAADVRVSEGPVLGWSWVTNVVFARPVPPAFADVLAGASPTSPPQARLSGGLRVGPSTYLAGGAPDVLLPPGSDPYSLLLDGKPYVDDTPDDYVVNLPTHLPSGRHVVEIGDDRLGFRVEPEMQAQPQATRLGYPLDRTAGSPVVFASSASPLQPGEDGVIGARVRGLDGEPLLLVRAWPGQDVLVLTDEGAIVEVFPDVPRWMLEASLEPTTVNVARALRGVPGTAAFVLVRTPATGRVHAVEVPRGFAPAPGTVPVRERPDLLADVTVAWHQHGPVDSARRSRALSAALRRAQGDPRPGRPVPSRGPAHVNRLAVPTDTRDGLLDVMLGWLSELEDGVTSSARFRDTWAWLTTARGDGDPADWRLALYQLQILGHVEVDYGRSRVGVAPPVANVLTRGRGFASLCGARPESLVRALVTGRTGDPVVDDVGMHWETHLRVQRDEDGAQRGPVAIYLEWDPDHQASVDHAFAALGVHVSHATSDVLLSLVPGLERRLDAGDRYDVPPAQDAVVKRTYRDEWQPTRAFGRRGLFRFATRRGPLFAWCEGPGEPLVRVDRRIGIYLLLQDVPHEARRERPLLYRDADRSTLLVARGASLTPLLARALVLRTGLVPRPLDGPANAFGRSYLEYQNVEQQAAERVADLLRQPLGYL